MKAWLFSFVLLSAVADAQQIDTVLFNEIGRYQHPYVLFPDSFSAATFSSRIDRLDRPYVYMACGDSGLITLDITVPSAPVVSDRKQLAEFGGLRVNNLEQVDDLLYVCLGNFEGGQAAGLAIVDVSDASTPTILDTWSDGNFDQGSAIVKVKDGMAYLGAMDSGVVVLDVSDPADIQFVSSYLPDLSWPGIAGYPPNARGMAISGDVLFLAFDAGGLRAIDISTPTALSEIGRYVNPNIPILTNPAYNNVVIVGDRAYCAIDYCGLEVIDISDPANMTQVAWLNPWNCIGLSWFGSDGHTNELLTIHNDSLLFVSGADTEILVYDITDTDAPVLKGGVMMPNDSAATWGVDVFGDLAVGNFINTHGLPLQPYVSKYGGVVLYDWQVEFATALLDGSIAHQRPFLAQNPSCGTIMVVLPSPDPSGTRVGITDVYGRLVRETTLYASAASRQLVELEMYDRAPGLYHITVVSSAGRSTLRAVLVNE